MTENTARIPEGQPSNQSVLVAVVSAPTRTSAHAVASAGSEARQRPTGESGGAHLRGDGDLPRSATAIDRWSATRRSTNE